MRENEKSADDPRFDLQAMLKELEAEGPVHAKPTVQQSDIKDLVRNLRKRDRER